MIDATVWNGPLKREYRECDQWRERALALIDEERPEIVFMASADMYEIVDEDGERIQDGSEAEPIWRESLSRYLAEVKARAPRVVVLADTPRVGYDPAECLATSPGIEDCTALRTDMVDLAYAEVETAAAADAGTDLISATDWLCFEEDCPIVRGDYLVYRDRHHLTATFAAVLSERLGVALDAVMGDADARE